ncbi:MAG: aspartate--tRNA(Asn) ligase [archaeon]|nr:aspartate--tRNA(Asn) ligase [archaeon]
MTCLVRDSSTVKIEDKIVTVKGWVQDIKNLGGISFITLRDRHGTVQITLPKKKVEKETFKSLVTLTRESTVIITGEIQKSDQTALGLEIIPTDVKICSRADTPLPMGVVDKVNVEIDTRLNNRFIDARRPDVKSIFELKSIMIKSIVDVMTENGFVQVNTPKIVGSGAEGGSTLFKIDYFGRSAYLAQSPQLYKQMLMSTGLDRVFEISPAFRAEKSNTSRHVTEFISFDGELAWIDSQKDVMNILETVIDQVLRKVNERGKEQLDILGKKIRLQPVPYPVLTYKECVKIVNDSGIDLKDGDDIGTREEKIIGDYMASKRKDLYFITEYPSASKPFYIMNKDGTSYSCSFDLDFKGQEISSGGQREHRFDRLIARMKELELNPNDFVFYTSAFRYGMPPHGGWGIGIDRLLTKMLDLPNVREGILFPRDVSRLSP